MNRLRTRGLDHVALTVTDLERSSAFYERVLGLERAYEEWHEPVFLLASGTGLALFRSDSKPDTQPGAAPAARLLHIAFRVDREVFDGARESLGEHDIEARFADHGACHSLYFADPDGHELELTCYEV